MGSNYRPQGCLVRITFEYAGRTALDLGSFHIFDEAHRAVRIQGSHPLGKREWAGQFQIGIRGVQCLLVPVKPQKLCRHDGNIGPLL